MPFESALDQVLPTDLPGREVVIAKAALHLRLIDETNQQFNLTSGSGLCPGNGYFTASYAPVQDTTQGSATVYVN